MESYDDLSSVRDQSFLSYVSLALNELVFDVVISISSFDIGQNVYEAG